LTHAESNKRRSAQTKRHACDSYFGASLSFQDSARFGNRKARNGAGARHCGTQFRHLETSCWFRDRSSSICCASCWILLPLRWNKPNMVAIVSPNPEKLLHFTV
jgi:hypothetical protein